MNTVVLHPGALGDVLLAIPAMRALGVRGEKLVLAAQPRIGRLVVELGIADRSVDFDTLGLEALFAGDEPAERLTRLLAGARVVSWFGSRDVDGFARRLRSVARESVVAASTPSGGLAVWEHLLASVGPLVAGAASPEAWREPVAPGAEMLDAGRRALASAGWDGVRPLVMLHPGAGGIAKRWPVEGFARVAEDVAASGADVVVHEGPADRDAVAALRDRLRVPVRALVDPPLGALAGAIHHAALFVGNDSGVTHLAAAVGSPTLALFVAAHVAWRPWARHARVRVVSAPTLAPSDLDAVVEDAMDRLKTREARAGGARGR